MDSGFAGCAAPRNDRTIFQTETVPFNRQSGWIEDAIAAERQVKSRRREKKQALIRDDHTVLPYPASRSKRATNAPT